jgi:hypothetical protein
MLLFYIPPRRKTFPAKRNVIYQYGGGTKCSSTNRVFYHSRTCNFPEESFIWSTFCNSVGRSAWLVSVTTNVTKQFILAPLLNNKLKTCYGGSCGSAPALICDQSCRRLSRRWSCSSKQIIIDIEMGSWLIDQWKKDISSLETSKSSYWNMIKRID